MAFHEYPYTDFHEMNLDWVIAKVKELTLAWAQTSSDWEELRTFVNNYFANLNVQEEINNKMDELVSDGTLSSLIAPYVASGLPAEVANQIAGVVAEQIGAVVAAQLPAQVAEQIPGAVAGEAANWLSEHVDPSTGYVVDDTLTIQGAAADAKAAGDGITEVKSAISKNFNDAIAYMFPSLNGVTSARYGVLNKKVEYRFNSGDKFKIAVNSVSGSNLVSCKIYGYIDQDTYSTDSLVITDIGALHDFQLNDNDYDGFYIFVTFADKGVQANIDITIFSDSETNSIIGNIINVSESVNAISGNISSIESDIDDIKKETVQFITLNDAVYYSNTKAQSVNGTGDTYEWLSTHNKAIVIDEAIENAKGIYSLTINATANSEYYLGLVTKENDHATIEFIEKAKAITTGDNEIIVNWRADSQKIYYPFVQMIRGASYYGTYDSSIRPNHYSTFTKDNGIEVGNVYELTQEGTNGIKFILTKILVEKKKTKGIITVAKEGGDYNTISEAVTYAKTISSVDNPITIIICPGIYDEVVNIGANKYISLIGVNRDTCIIRDKSGRYRNSPLLASGTFLCKNLSFIVNHDEAGEWYPTWVIGDNTTYASYCVHVDGYGGSEGAEGYAHFENCYFYSECLNCAGLGLISYQTICFENCEFVRYVTDDNYLNDNYKGAVACHSSTGPLADEVNEKLVMRNCVVKMLTDTKAMQLYHYHIGSPMKVECIDCTLVDKNGITNTVYFRHDTKTDYIVNTSHGNNTDELNYTV